ncbi:TPA: hypothetical protein ACH3X1_001051 [Trebouxia sp. C0004]
MPAAFTAAASPPAPHARGPAVPSRQPPLLPEALQCLQDMLLHPRLGLCMGSRLPGGQALLTAMQMSCGHPGSGAGSFSAHQPPIWHSVRPSPLTHPRSGKLLTEAGFGCCSPTGVLGLDLSLGLLGQGVEEARDGAKGIATGAKDAASALGTACTPAPLFLPGSCRGGSGGGLGSHAQWSVWQGGDPAPPPLRAPRGSSRPGPLLLRAAQWILPPPVSPQGWF